MKIFLKGTRGRFDKDNHPTLTFPLNIEYTDGHTQEISDKDELKAVKESCE